MYCRYYLASAADDSVVKLWDLRKLKNFKTIELESNYQVRSLSLFQILPCAVHTHTHTHPVGYGGPIVIVVSSFAGAVGEF